MTHSNHLIHESSPYLLQHAHNPVDWYPWKDPAFARAKAENKPILVSIGYSTCHWCHVMERESFEDESVAAFMNAHFINIKVDREERPDVDKIYMEAVQAITGSGGWPLNCFLTPEGKPFFAGTYYPPEPKYNRPSWLQVLHHIKKIFEEKRETVEEQANRLIQYIEKANQNFLNDESLDPEVKMVFGQELSNSIFKNLKDRFDSTSGGFGSAPKFPNTMALNYLLQYYSRSKEEEAKTHVLFSVDKMILGGIYDQLGGGFARYATDRDWLIPHFEKMLYDNALLISLIAEAYKLTQDPLYQRTIEQTLDFVKREMTAPAGGFYAALDADSEGVEGKFYVWDKSEIDGLLGPDSEIFCQFYGVSHTGNWEGKNILWRRQRLEEFAREKGIAPEELREKLDGSRQKLLQQRSGRIRPGLDDKILLHWNALQCSAYADAYMALGREEYKTAAQSNLSFLLSAFKKPDSIELYHTLKHRQGQAPQLQYDAFLDDYAFTVQAILKLYSVSFDNHLLEQAKAYCDLVIRKFYDPEDGMFFFTGQDQTDIVVRKKELYDSAIPSGNAVMVQNLQLLAKLLENEEYRQISERMLSQLKDSISRYPASFGQWALGILAEVDQPAEVAVVGPQAIDKARQINALFLPGKMIMASVESNDQFPLLRAKRADEDTLIYLCRNYACQKPVKTIEEFVELLA